MCARATTCGAPLLHKEVLDLTELHYIWHQVAKLYIQRRNVYMCTV